MEIGYFEEIAAGWLGGGEGGEAPEVLLERFSAVVSDVCACLMGFKVRLDHFGRKNLFGH